jgi:hypothetical protein
MSLQVSNLINFYEKNFSSLTSIKFQDNTQFTQDLTSSSTIDDGTEASQGVYFSNSIALESFESEISQVVPTHPILSRSIAGSRKSTLTHSYGSEFLKNVYINNGFLKLNLNLVNHTIHNFIR